jgi:hypothetical protein
MRTLTIPKKTWTKITEGEAIEFQVLNGKVVYWKYSETQPAAVPYVDEPAFHAVQKIVYQSTKEFGNVWVYSADVAFVAVGEKPIINTRNFSKYCQKSLIPMNRIVFSTLTAAVTSIDSKTIVVDDATGIIVGHFVIMFNATLGTAYYGTVLNIATNTLTMDTPINDVYPVGSNVDATVTNMAVDGSVTPVKFRRRGAGITNLTKTLIISRLMFQMFTDTVPNFDTFGDIARLENGVVMREINGSITHIFNIKSNADLASLTFDYNVYQATNPAQGEDGLTARLSFGGDSKIGAAIELKSTEDLEIIIQDDLSDIVIFKIIAEGYFLSEGFNC